MSQVSYQHQVHYHDQGDFLVDDQHIFEIGGANKTSRQIQQQNSAYFALDDIEVGYGNHIPLWLFGLLY